jgi:hypothetical protein
MLVETLDEAIKVRADFRGGEVTPLLFKRGGRDGQTLRVKKVCARWEDTEREARRYYFSVEAILDSKLQTPNSKVKGENNKRDAGAGGDIYEIHLDAGTMTWRLDRVCLTG